MFKMMNGLLFIPLNMRKSFFLIILLRSTISNAGSRIPQKKQSLILQSEPLSRPPSPTKRCTLKGYIQAIEEMHLEEVTVGASLRPTGDNDVESATIDYITIAYNTTSHPNQHIHLVQHYMDAGIPIVDSKKLKVADGVKDKCKDLIIRYATELESNSNVNESKNFKHTKEAIEKWALAVISYEANARHYKQGMSIVELGHHQTDDTTGNGISSYVTFYTSEKGPPRLAGLRSRYVGFYEMLAINEDNLDDLIEHVKLLTPTEDIIDSSIKQGIQYARYIYKGLDTSTWRILSRNQGFIEGADMLQPGFSRSLTVSSIVKLIRYKLTGATGMLNETSSVSLLMKRESDGALVNIDV